MQEIIARLEEARAKIEEAEGRKLSDNDFTRRFLAFSATTYSRVKAGSYQGNLAAIADKMEAAIATIEAQLPILAEEAKRAKGFVKTQIARAAITALTRAKSGVDGRRIVAVLAPTGFGKSAIADYLKSKGAVTVEGRQAWRNSYKAFCADIARALGRNIPAAWPEFKVEEEMIRALGSKDGILYLDEANTMSSACANAIKYIVNKTGYTVIIAAIPQMWDKFLSGNRDEVLQLINRCQPVIRASRIPPADAEAVLTMRGVQIASKVASRVAKAATDFGGFRTVFAIANALQPDATEEDVAIEIRQHMENVIASGIGR